MNADAGGAVEIRNALVRLRRTTGLPVAFGGLVEPGRQHVRISELRVLDALNRDESPEIRLWPDQVQPLERIGKGILLFRFPDSLPPPSSRHGTAHFYCR